MRTTGKLVWVDLGVGGWSLVVDENTSYNLDVGNIDAKLLTNNETYTLEGTVEQGHNINTIMNGSATLVVGRIVTD